MKALSRLAAACLTTTVAVVPLTVTAAQADGAKVVVVGGKADDLFFAKIKKGIDDAALVVKAHGGSVTYLQLQTYDNIGGDGRQPHPDRDQSSMPVLSPPPTGSPTPRMRPTRPPLRRIFPSCSTTPAARTKPKSSGAINFIGNEENIAGLAGGEYFGTHGAKNVICVNTVPGAGNLEARCQGIADGIAKQGRQIQAIAVAGLEFR